MYPNCDEMKTDELSPTSAIFALHEILTKLLKKVPKKLTFYTENCILNKFVKT
jgi:hypothetical protein